jgi:sulfur relay (sulfurtransferase) complex TusBCD TusD component (DsrE family)
MTIDRERERPGVAMDNSRRTTEVVQTGGVNVVLCIEALLARLIGVG